MNETQAAIKVQDLEMAFGNFVVQHDLTFDIKKGEVFIIMGDSGSGKSTLLRHMIGLQKPNKGAVLYGETDFWSLDNNERIKYARRFGVLYQSGALWSSMTLAENIGMPIREYMGLSEKDIAALVSFKLALVGLAGFEDYYPSEISGGMKKRAGLARAMALDPDILFFDEPSAGLDPISSRLLDDLILELRASLGSTIVVVTHELASIFTIADNSVFVDAEARTMTALGNPRDLRDNPPSEKVSVFLNRGHTSMANGSKTA